MDSLSALVAFVRTAETLSFVGAGRAIGVSASAVGKSVARLEHTVGVRLFQRSTRRVRLTEEGARFYERCRRILDDLQDAEAMLSDAAGAPRGRLRVSAPTIGYRFLLPILPAFLARHPQIELELDFTDRLVDVIDEGLDVVIRSGAQSDSRLMARRLAPFRFVLCASPAYLKRHGVPRTPPELASHRCVRFRVPTTGRLQAWALTGGAEPRLPTALICNNMEAVHLAALGGVGLAYLPDFLARDAIAARALRTVLDDFLVNPGQFWALWPSSRQPSPRLRAFVDFLSARLVAAPDDGS
jgi:DNA-binding transcriptional LysR family regulator